MHRQFGEQCHLHEYGEQFAESMRQQYKMSDHLNKERVNKEGDKINPATTKEEKIKQTLRITFAYFYITKLITKNSIQCTSP